MSNYVTIFVLILIAGFGLLSFCANANEKFATQNRDTSRHLAVLPFNYKPFRGDVVCHLLLPLVTKSHLKSPNVTIYVTLINKGLAPKSDVGDVSRRLFDFFRAHGKGMGPRARLLLLPLPYRLRCSRRGNGRRYRFYSCLYMPTHVLSLFARWFRVPLFHISIYGARWLP